MNIAELTREADLYRAERRVLSIQTKLHHWAKSDPDRRFADLFNLVADPAFLGSSGYGVQVRARMSW